MQKVLNLENKYNAFSTVIYNCTVKSRYIELGYFNISLNRS